MNDDFLNRFRRPPPPRFADRLYERIASPMLTQTPHAAERRAAAPRAVRGAWLAALGTVAICLSALLLFPSARAFAGGIIQHIGGYGFTQDPSQVAPVNKTSAERPAQSLPGIVKTHDSVYMQANGKVPGAPDAAGASRLAGFTVLAPSYLPAGYRSMSDWLVTQQGNGQVASQGFRDGTNHFFVVNEWNAASSAEQDYPRTAIVNVRINGQPGVWLPDTSGGEARKNALVWEQNGITCSLVTDSLGLDELTKVANGLGK
jgi:hypothetical protein